VSEHFEREQRFLVDGLAFLTHLARHPQFVLHEIAQGYVAIGSRREVRVRASKQNQPPGSTLTQMAIKRQLQGGRGEIEFFIPDDAFAAIWETLDLSLEKLRYSHVEGAPGWEVDFFTKGPLDGLVVAEFELPAGADSFEAERARLGAEAWPSWVRRDVELTDVKVNYIAAGALPLTPELAVRLGVRR